MIAGDLPSVLLVEDEPAQRAMLAYNLAAEGYRVREAADGAAALLGIAEDPPDLVLLDWMLPDLSGIELCRRLKSRAATRAIAVIMLSARSEEVDRIRGLETGADDYVSKPYSIAELMARVRANLRRVRPSLAGVVLEFRDLTLDSATRRVTRAGRPVRLGPTEFRLLAALIETPGRVFSRERLLDLVWGRDIAIGSRTVDMHIARLRRALGEAGGEAGGDDPVRTVRGVGYALG